MSSAPGRAGSSAPRPLRTERPLGRIELFRSVVADVSGHTALECYGVMALAARNLREGVAVRRGRSSLHRGVEVHETPEGLDIDLYVVVRYGVRITEVAHNLQRAVAFEVGRIAGVPVGFVNVHVQGVQDPGDDPPTGVS